MNDTPTPMAAPLAPSTSMPRNPIQPLIIDSHGTKRFKANKIVEWLCDQRAQCMNEIARMDFTRDDRRQFAQLIGYSHSGYAELGYSDDFTFDEASDTTSAPNAYLQAQVDYLEAELEGLRQALREPMARLYDKHPDDLCEPPEHL